MGSKFTKPIPVTNKRKSTLKTKSLKMDNLSLEQTVSAEAKFLKIVKEKNRDFEDMDLIDPCLSRHFFIGNIESKSRREIIKEMSLASVPANTLIFKQTDIGKYFYVIKTGEVLIENNSFSKKLGPGESFGELALLHESARSANCKSTKDCLFYVLERRIFRKIIEHMNFISYETNKKFIESIHILSKIETDQKSILCSNLLRQIFREGDYIVKQGDKANCLYIIKEGEVECVSKGKLIRTLIKGDYFGEKALLLDEPREMDVIAKTKCLVYSISVETLKRMVGEQYRNTLFMNFIKISFSNSVNFKNINPKTVEKIFNSFKAVNIGKDSILYHEGHKMSSKLTIIIEGNLLNVI